MQRWGLRAKCARQKSNGRQPRPEPLGLLNFGAEGCGGCSDTTASLTFHYPQITSTIPISVFAGDLSAGDTQGCIRREGGDPPPSSRAPCLCPATDAKRKLQWHS